MKLRSWKSAAAFGLLAVLAVAPAQAQEKIPYPVDSVTLVTHSSPGGGTDVFLREMVKHLGKYIDADFVVENVRGGGGAKAMAHLAESKADGSVLYGTTPSYINTSLLSKPDVDYTSMTPVANMFLDPQVVFVKADSPFKTLTDVIDEAKKRPNAVRVAVSTPGSLDRQVMEQLKVETGTEMIVITHDGGGEVMLSVLNGTGEVGIGEIQELRGQIDAGEIRLITTYTAERLAQYPDVPTAKEQGIDLVVDKFRGLAGPKDLAPEAIAAWEAAIPKLLEDPDVKAWYEAGALVPTFIPHTEYSTFIDEFAKEQQAFFTKYNITEE